MPAEDAGCFSKILDRCFFFVFGFFLSCFYSCLSNVSIRSLSVRVLVESSTYLNKNVLLSPKGGGGH